MDCIVWLFCRSFRNVWKLDPLDLLVKFVCSKMLFYILHFTFELRKKMNDLQKKSHRLQSRKFMQYENLNNFRVNSVNSEFIRINGIRGTFRVFFWSFSCYYKPVHYFGIKMFKKKIKCLLELFCLGKFDLDFWSRLSTFYLNLK